MQYGFYKYALLADLLWVAGCWKSIYQEIKKSCNVTVWSIIVKDNLLTSKFVYWQEKLE